MSRFMNEVVVDIRGGRETWRVFVALCLPAAVLGFTLALV